MEKMASGFPGESEFQGPGFSKLGGYAGLDILLRGGASSKPLGLICCRSCLQALWGKVI